jgi:flagellar secretion chaperone FliS
MSAVINHAMNQYKQVGTGVSAAAADPHQLIAMLYDGALEKIAIAKGAMARKDVAKKGQKIGRAILIIDGLRASLDKEKGGEIAANLDALYDYMQRCLFKANVENDVYLLDEVSVLIRDVKSAWEAIAPEKDMAISS